MATEAPRKLRVLGLHGFRTSGAILKKQLSKWTPAVHDLLDITYLDGPTPAQGESDFAHIFEGPYFEWMQSNKDYSKFFNYRESLAYIMDFMEKNGPFDGVLGFSQGCTLAGCLVAVQQRKWEILGKSAADLPPIRFYIAIAGAHLRDPGIHDVYLGSPIDVPSLHFSGEKDPLHEPSTFFLRYWKDPVVITHPAGHTVPRLDETTEKTVVTFLKQFHTAQPAAADEIVEK
ncbi:hypothetical protein MPTK1_1g17540 [Marchantia polymorpha subsp. ruderalis]|uniref:Serine hydrolase domain-containing protein n=2 Tax=Marchantia polymorpha TaxID=3197 RepID=A0AAF6AR88_MARPO|nr:hypothetical protein MARPO_0001s0094 [Marchantia polymorpha]BBM98958.1 hypothetical protein Mp_1g17540 [Marchantia polymorpha subsp. ruderalis]|eukprot:PTQ50035.1 hypothetical protein MARPO_0001s0094 [Marchantia polymorpha]